MVVDGGWHSPALHCLRDIAARAVLSKVMGLRSEVS